MEQEIWKPIPNFEGLYEASNTGRVKALKKTVMNGANWLKKLLYEERILKQSISSNSKYNKVTLQHKKVKRTYTVHRLVALIFIPNPENKSQVNHIDGDKQNNHVSNLEWCTASENSLHAVKLGLYKTLFKEMESNLTAVKCQNTETGKVYLSIKEAYIDAVVDMSYFSFHQKMKKGQLPYKRMK